MKTGFRLGDTADMAIIELVDFNEAAIAATKKETKKPATRRSRKSAPKAEAAAPAVEEAPKAEEAVAEEAKAE